MRKIIVAGNWKMNKTNKEAVSFLSELKGLVNGINDVEAVIGAPFTALSDAVKEVEGSNIKIAAQNMNPNESGAYTGEISPLMLKELGVEYVILGHSERREYYGETNEFINAKVKAALNHGIKPILCVRNYQPFFSVHIYIENIAVVWIIRILFSLPCGKPVTAKDLRNSGAYFHWFAFSRPCSRACCLPFCFIAALVSCSAPCCFFRY